MPTVGLSAARVNEYLNVDLLALAILTSVCLLVPTNGIGSNGLNLTFVWVLVTQARLRDRWWQAMWPLLLAACAYLLFLSAIAYSPFHALRDAWAALRGILFSLQALYLCSLSQARLTRTAQAVVVLMTGMALGVLLYNFHRHGVIITLTREKLDTLVHRNRLAVGLATGLLLASALIAEATHGKQRALMLACALTLLAISCINDSRGSLLGIAASLAMFGLYRYRRQTLAVLAAATLLMVTLWQRGMLIHLITHQNGSIANSRDHIWQSVFARINIHPWIGHGLHAMPFDPVYNTAFVQWMHGHPHSIYLELLYSSGIVGALFWLTWFILLRSRLGHDFVSKSRLSHSLGLMLLVYVLVHGLVDFSFYSLLTFVLLVVGLTCLAIPYVGPMSGGAPVRAGESRNTGETATETAPVAARRTGRETLASSSSPYPA